MPILWCCSLYSTLHIPITFPSLSCIHTPDPHFHLNLPPPSISSHILCVLITFPCNRYHNENVVTFLFRHVPSISLWYLMPNSLVLVSNIKILVLRQQHTWNFYSLSRLSITISALSHIGLASFPTQRPTLKVQQLLAWVLGDIPSAPEAMQASSTPPSTKPSAHPHIIVTMASIIAL